MYNIERKALIVSLLKKDSKVSVNQLAQMLEISKETVRRDLRELEQDGLIQRTHGGAVLETSGGNTSEYPFKMREIQNYEEKAKICKAAAQLIEDGDTIFIDNSSTTISLIKNINPAYQVTVITNSIKLLIESVNVNNPNLVMISLGGIFRAKNLSLTGILANEWVHNFRPNKAFLSCRAIRPESGFIDGSIYEVDTKRAMIDNAQHVYVLADHSKFHEQGAVYLTDFSKVELVITDDGADEESLRMLGLRGVKTHVAC
ncbi:DeoR/GlpR family DNA-binding transcription regulator [Anaerotruncus colihominis]|uniref:DeoR/GlpR family DNA-binding transcription regulator n=1 Tax=Anaerotruncus colihominis TaxID=169435 RepID=UPI0035178220